MNNLTPSQKHLSDSLFNTKTNAKVRRRKQNPDGTFEFYLITRDTAPIDFRVDPGEFVFKHHEVTPNAPLSPMYVNLRSMPEKLVSEIGKVMSEMTFEQTPDFCAGIPKAADPIVKEFSKYSGIPEIKVFEKVEEENKRVIVPLKDATLGEGKKLLIIDDLITKAGSKLEAIHAAEELGYKVVGVAVLIDRGEGGSESMQEAGYKLYASMKLSDMLDYYLEKKMITQEQFNETQKYLEQSRK